MKDINSKKIEMNQLVPFLHGDKWGFCMRYPDVKIVIDCIYDKVRPFQTSFAAVYCKGKWGLINENGDWLTEPIYDDIGNVSEGMVPYSLNGKWGLLDESFKTVIDPDLYDQINQFREGRAIVVKDGRYGFIDKEGRLVVDMVYDGATEFKDGFASVLKDGKYGCIDREGVIVFDFVSEIAIVFSEGNAAVAIMYPNSGMEMTEQRKKDHYIFHNRFDYPKGALFGYIDERGSYVIEPSYEEAHNFEDGLALTLKDGRFGFINQSNEVVVPHIYSDAGKFREGWARVMSEKYKWGFIDQKGKIKIPFIMDDAYDFSEGLARVNCQKGLLDYFREDLRFTTKKLSTMSVVREDPSKHGSSNVDIDKNLAKFERDPDIDVFITKNGEYIYYPLSSNYKDGTDGVYYFKHKGFSEGVIGLKWLWSDIFFIYKDGRIISGRNFLSADPFKGGLTTVQINISDSNRKSIEETVYLDISGFIYWHPVSIIKYDSVKVGYKEWSRKNTRLDEFPDGSKIRVLKSMEEMHDMQANEGIPACCSYDFDPQNDSTYGKLYNWYTLSEQVKLAGEGWRLPSVQDLEMLFYTYNHQNGSKLFSVHLKGDKGLTVSGFDGSLSGGFTDGVFSGKDDYTVIWSSTEHDETSAIGLIYEKSLIESGKVNWDFLGLFIFPKNSFFSVRMIKENS